MKSICILLLLLFCFFSIEASAQSDTISKKKFHWGGKQQDTSYGYAQAVLVDNVLYISGVPGMGADMGAQLKSLYRGIEATLKAYGATFQNVVKETLFTTDIAAVEQHNAVRKTYYKGDYPAASWVQVSRLLMPQALVEVEVIAHLTRK
ncbi:MAG TPA: RidA family protein [Flavisolibacter sp.]|nr:RidA family protein [Flavisolibacter sp.]